MQTMETVCFPITLNKAGLGNVGSLYQRTLKPHSSSLKGAMLIAGGEKPDWYVHGKSA